MGHVNGPLPVVIKVAFETMLAPFRDDEDDDSKTNEKAGMILISNLDLTKLILMFVTQNVRSEPVYPPCCLMLSTTC